MMPGETEYSRRQLGMPRDPHISDYQVMHTPAGHYVGTVHTNCGACNECKEDGLHVGFQQPQSRETEYARTRQEAEADLRVMLAGGHPASLRTPEFNHAGAEEITTVELPATATAEDIYRALHPEEFDDEP